MTRPEIQLLLRQRAAVEPSDIKDIRLSAFAASVAFEVRVDVRLLF
jgi:hypothetical protein